MKKTNESTKNSNKTHKQIDASPANHSGSNPQPTGVRSGERADVDRISDGLIARRVNHVPKNLFDVLDGASLRVSVSQEDQLLLLSGPKTPNALPIHLRHTFAEKKRGRQMARLKASRTRECGELGGRVRR